MNYLENFLKKQILVRWGQEAQGKQKSSRCCSSASLTVSVDLVVGRPVLVRHGPHLEELLVCTGMDFLFLVC